MRMQLTAEISEVLPLLETSILKSCVRKITEFLLLLSYLHAVGVILGGHFRDHSGGSPFVGCLTLEDTVFI